AHGFLQAQALFDVVFRAGTHSGQNLTECLAAIAFDLERALQLCARDLLHSKENLAGQLPLLSVAEGAQGWWIESGGRPGVEAGSEHLFPTAVPRIHESAPERASGATQWNDSCQFAWWHQSRVVDPDRQVAFERV